MRKVIGCFLIIFLLFSSVAFSFGSSSITILQDIDDHWIATQHREVLYLLQHLGIVKGYEDHSFRPQSLISRQEFVTMLIKTLEPKIEVSLGTATFQDVDKNLWGFPYIEKAVEKNIILPHEYDNEKFQPEKAITRLEIAIMIMRGLGVDIDDERMESTTPFLDDEEIPMEAKTYIRMAYERGIIKGYREGDHFLFKPNSTATRAEAVVMIYNLLQQKKDLKQVGYYAIQSFQQAGSLPLEKMFDEVVFGWSTLNESEDGSIIFSMESPNEYRRPVGYEEALAIVDHANVDRKLMLTETRTSLIYRLLEDQKNQQQVIQDIIRSLGDYGFTGIVMDLENIRNLEKGYRGLYVGFLEELKEKLTPQNYTLTVTVQPNNVIGYYDGYDYKAISEIADEINIMTHDYHERRNLSVLTDHAPLPLVKEALVKLLDAGVDPDKVMLGLQVAAGTQWVTTLQGEDQSREFFTPSMTSVYRAMAEIGGGKEL